jgi:hypothetical protein
MSVILRASNYDLLREGKPLTYLADTANSGDNTLTVQSIAGFTTSDMVAIGVLGEERTEIIQLHASTSPTGTTITLDSNLLQDHEEGAPVYVIDYDQIEWSRATTETGTKSVLSADSIAADAMHSIYDDTTNSTGFGFYRWKNSDSSAFSNYSDPIPYAGYEPNTAHNIFQRALSTAGQQLSPHLRYEKLYDFLNDFIAMANDMNRKWSNAKVIQQEMGNISTGDWEADLPSDIALKKDPSAIMGIRISDNGTLRYVSPQKFNSFIHTMQFTTLNGDVADTDTSIVLTNSSAFGDSGTVLVNGDTIEYTGNNRATNTLTGVTGIVSGGHSDGDYVFQDYTTGTPFIYTIPSEGKARFWPLADASINNEVIFIDYYKRIPQVNSLGDDIVVPYTKAAIDYMAYRIKKFAAGGTLSVGDEDYQQFQFDFKRMIEQDVSGEPIKIRIK